MIKLFWSTEGFPEEDRELLGKTQGDRRIQMNFYSKKSKKIMSTIIIVIVVLAMVIPVLAYAL